MDGNLPQILAIVLSIIAVALATFGVLNSRKTGSIRSLFTLEDEPENLQDIIGVIAKKIKKLEVGFAEHDDSLAKITDRLDTAIQFVGIVRFDSASSDGGNLSFSAALLDASQTGIVITSLHGRQHNRVYIKQVKNGASESILSDEEKEAIVKAVTNKNTKTITVNDKG